MKFIKRFSTMLLIIVVVLLVLFASPKPSFDKDNIWRKEANNNQVLVMAHAGGKGVYPDNTMSAFRYSYNLGVDVLEMDLMMTSDGILVLRHGENNTGNIRQYSNCDTVIWNETYEYLYNNCNFAYNYQNDEGDYPYRDLSFEEWVEQEVYLTTLEELFIEFGDSILYNIEIKADADAPREETADALYDLLEEYDLIEETLVATSFHDISTYIHDTYPDITLSTSHDEAQSMIIHSYTLSSSFYNPGNYAGLQLPTSFTLPIINELDLTLKLLISTAHWHNMAVHYWTINDRETMEYLIEQGCDGIITDYPELLMEVIDDLS
jgi:glycerophosphoryl diester phosphodiesterase